VDEGGRFALSDDSHGPHAVGLNYHRAYDYLKDLEVTQIWYLERSATPNQGNRFVQAAKMEGDWSNHVFWKGRK
jgi:histidinol-phosphatase (PHP family)